MWEKKTEMSIIEIRFYSLHFSLLISFTKSDKKKNLYEMQVNADIFFFYNNIFFGPEISTA